MKSLRHGTARHGTARHGTGVKIYVHIDKSSSINPADIDSRAKIIQNRISVGGGEGSITQATLNSIEEIDKQEPDYSHICLLSGQDYPIKSNEEIFNTIQEGKDYMHYRDVYKQTGWKIQMRFETGGFNRKSYLWRGIGGRIALFHSRVLHIRRKPLPNATLYFGSAGGTLSQASIKFVIDFVHNPENRNFIDFFRGVYIADEHFFQCVLCNSIRKDNIINVDARYTDMKPWCSLLGVAHPKNLTLADYDSIVQSDKLFCRKVDLVQSQELVDKLDEYRNT